MSMSIAEGRGYELVTQFQRHVYQYWRNTTARQTDRQ